MAEYRTVRMSFWTDPYVEELSAEGKLLYIYLFTCPQTNNLGILETVVRRIAYETGLNAKTISALLDDMESQGKIMRDGNFIWLLNFIKNQCTTSPKLVQNMKAMLADVPSRKIRHALCLRYPHIFECSKEDMQETDTVSEEKSGEQIPHKYPTDTVSIPYANGTDTVGIPSGEIGNRKYEMGSGNFEGEDIPAHAPARVKEPEKNKYGLFQKVLLTDEEHRKLEEQFGIKGAEDRIESLDEYIASKGAKYKSHYATILAWHRKDAGRDAARPSQQGYLTEAERRQAHNDAVCRQVAAELEAADSPF